MTTRDSLNAQVEAQVYFKVRSDEESVKASQYNVYNYMVRCGISPDHLKEYHRHDDIESSNSERGKINSALYNNLA